MTKILRKNGKTIFTSFFNERHDSFLSDKLKTKEDDQNYIFYYRIRDIGVINNGMNHMMKLWKRIIQWRLRYETHITKSQFGFMMEGSAMEVI
ncbi:hypothetical protein Lal_00002163 [Lupinus albus]|nr:hypothetical protein Lal_00002163 [Lupinus albus]